MKRLLLILSLFMVIGVGFYFATPNVRSAVYLQEFESPEELQDWLDRTVVVEFVAASDGNIGFDVPSGRLLGLDFATSDCDDYARELQRKAMYDGYILSLALTDEYGIIGRTKVASEYHMGNLAVINNGMWYVEPAKAQITYLGDVD